MTDLELIEHCTRVIRKTRDADTIAICSEIMGRIATLALPARPPFDKRSYMRTYMRAYRIKKHANPFA